MRRRRAVPLSFQQVHSYVGAIVAYCHRKVLCVKSFCSTVAVFEAAFIWEPHLEVAWSHSLRGVLIGVVGGGVQHKCHI